MKMKISEIVLDPNQPRKSCDPIKLRQLANDIRRNGLLHPIVVTKDKLLIAGWRRLQAVQLNDDEEIEVKVIDRELSLSELRILQTCENIHRTDLTNWEKWQALSELMCMNQDWKLQELAEHVSLDASTITRILSPSKCTTAWQEALKAGKVGISDCYAASKLPASEQDELLKMKLNGASRDLLEQQSRKKRNSVPSIKIAKVKIVLPNEISVVLSGNTLGMSEVVSILGEALKEARKAADQYDVKTWMNMMRDRAKGIRKG